MAKSVPSKNAELQRVLDRYDQLVAERNIDGLLPFLQNDIKGFLSGFKKHVLKSRRYWNAFIEFKKEEPRNGRKAKWGTRGDETQCKIVKLTALAVLNLSDTANFSDEISLLQLYPTDRHVQAVTDWAKAPWLARAIEEIFDKNDWFSFDYRLLRELEKKEIIQFSPRLFALSLTRLHRYQYEKEEKRLLHFLLTDTTLIERDIPLLFEYETRLHDRYSYFKIDDKQVQVWEYLLQKLLAEGKLDRKTFIEKTLQIQTKDWNNAIKLFFRKQLEAASPTTEELLEHQHTLFSFLHQGFPQVVNFGMEKIKQIHQQPGFDLAAFLDWLPPVLMRQDVASSVKKALQTFDYFFKNAPERGAELLAATADIFVIPDLEVQEQAAKRMLKNAQAGDAALREKLEQLRPQMLGNIRQSLTPILGEPEIAGPDDAAEHGYQVQTPEYRLLEEKITLPENWNDILFLLSRYLSGRDPLDAELILHTFQTRRHLFPIDYQAQLQPLLKQIGYWDNPHYVEIDNLMNGFLLQDRRFLRRLPKAVAPKMRVHAPFVFRHLTHLTQRKINRKSSLPLLCFPTHRPFWVAPKTLAQRLIDYQDAGEETDHLDLCVAISRMPRENAGEALELLPKLNPKSRRLMEFCLGASAQIFIKNENWKSKLLSLIGKTGEKTEEIAVWAVAARAFNPQGVFPEFEKTSVGGLPNVTRPLLPEIRFVRHPKREIPPRWKGGKTTVLPAYTGLNIPQPPYQPTPLHLLYSAGLFHKDEEKRWLWTGAPENALRFWHSLIPQYPAPLAWYCIVAKLGFKTILQVVRRPESRWAYPIAFAFCMAFYDDDKPTRFEASEALHFLIEENRLDTILFGRQLGDFVYAKFSALTRLIESLERVKDISPKHNAALFRILDALFARFFEKVVAAPDEQLPTHFKKLVEHFADLQAKTRCPASAATLGGFLSLEENQALKKLVSQIKSAKP